MSPRYSHSVKATAANVHDVTEAANLIRPYDEVVYGDAGHLGIEKRPEVVEDEHKLKIDCRINQRHGKAWVLAEGPARDWFKYEEYRKSSVPCKVKHAFHIIKNKFVSARSVTEESAKI